MSDGVGSDIVLVNSSGSAETFDLRRLEENRWSRVKAITLMGLGVGFLCFPAWWVLTQVLPRWG